MSIRCGASGRYLRRTANLPSATAYTVCGWVYINASAAGTFRYGITVEDAASSASNGHYLGFASDDIFELYTTAGSNFASNPSTGAWYFMYMRNNGTNITAGFRGLADASFITASSASTTFTTAVVYLGNDSYDEYCDWSFAGIRVYDTHLSDAQIEAEYYRLSPAFTGTLNVWTPGVVTGSTRTEDWSGNGRDWTAGGTLSDFDMPPVGYGARPVYVQSLGFAEPTQADVSPLAGSLFYGGTVVDVKTTAAVFPIAGSLLFSGTVPTVSTTADIIVNVSPIAGGLAFSGGVSDITTYTEIEASDFLSGALLFAGNVLAVSTEIRVSPIAGAVTFSGQVPTVATQSGEEVAVAPLAGSIYFGGTVPDVVTVVSVSPIAGVVAFTGHLSTVSTSVNVAPIAGALLFAGSVPTVSAVNQEIAQVSPIAGSLVFVGNVPTVSIFYDAVVSPVAGSLRFSGAAPTITLKTPFGWRKIDRTGGSWSKRGKASTAWTKLN